MVPVWMYSTGEVFQVRRLRIGPNFKRALFDPASFFWRQPANYNIHPLSFIDMDGRWVACNQSFANMTRRPISKIVGCRPESVFEADVAETVEEARTSALLQEQAVTCRFWQTFGHGPRLFVLCHVIPVWDEDGPIGHICDHRDDTALFLAEENMCDTMHILRHDLLNPLAAARLMLQQAHGSIGAAPGLDERLLAVRRLYDEAWELIRVCLTLHDEADLARPITGEWIAWDELQRELADRLRAQFGLRARLEPGRPNGGRIFWSKAKLLDLLLAVVRIVVEASNLPATVEIRFSLALITETRWQRISVRFNAPQIHPQTVDVRLASEMEILAALAKGIHIEPRLEDPQPELELRIPRAEMASRQPPCLSIAHVVFQDYDGEEFAGIRSFYQARFDLVEECTAMLDSDNRIRMCNLCFAELQGSVPEELYGRHHREFAAPPLSSLLDEVLAQLDGSPGYAQRNAVFCFRNEITWCTIVATNARENGRVVHLYNNKRFEFWLFMKSHMQKAFVHIRTRLDRLRTLYAALQAHPLPAGPMRTDLAWLARINEDMRQLVAHWMQVEDLAANRHPFHPRPIDLHALMEDMREDFARAGCCVILIPPRAAVRIPADAALLKSALMNLLKNACQASRRNEVSLAVLCNSREIELRVRNDGEVPASIRLDFFGKMVKGPESQGLGLGTYSARLAVERHGGRAMLNTSEPGYTTVSLFLPRAPESAD